jgi:hypothetical protein
MGNVFISLGVVFFLSLAARADVADGDSALQLPVETVFKLKYLLNIKPNITTTTLTTDEDLDKDGVMDNTDHCPYTAAGKKVWSWADVKEGKVEEKWVGCVGDEIEYAKLPENQWLKDIPPFAHCYLLHDSYDRDRHINTNAELTLKKVWGEDMQKYWSANPFTLDRHVIYLQMKTKKGVDLKIKCATPSFSLKIVDLRRTFSFTDKFPSEEIE